MARASIGMVLNQMLQEANLSAIHIAERMKKTKQNVYLDLKRTSMRDEQIEDWADALGISKTQIYDRWNNTAGITPQQDVLGEQVKKIEEYFKNFLQVQQAERDDLAKQLEVKDKQLEARDRQLEARDRQIEQLISLLGKPNPVIAKPKVRPMYQELRA